MFDIACVDIVDKAISVKGAIGESDKLRQYKESVIKKYKEDFFIVKGEKKNVLVYADMEEKLKQKIGTKRRMEKSLVILKQDRWLFKR